MGFAFALLVIVAKWFIAELYWEQALKQSIKCNLERCASLSTIDIAILLRGDVPRYWSHKSKLLTQSGDYLGAIHAAEVAARLEPLNPYPLANIVNLYLTQRIGLFGTKAFNEVWRNLYQLAPYEQSIHRALIPLLLANWYSLSPAQRDDVLTWVGRYCKHKPRFRVDLLQLAGPHRAKEEAVLACQ